MKYMAIVAIWLGYAGMVSAVAFWSHESIFILPVAIFAGIFAVVSTAFVANSK